MSEQDLSRHISQAMSKTMLARIDISGKPIREQNDPSLNKIWERLAEAWELLLEAQQMAGKL